jgi:hypothetical protein
MAFLREFTLDQTLGPARFLVIWMSFGYVNPQGQQKPIDIQRREASIARKLRKISEPADNARSLKAGDQKLVLEQPEIELIRSRIEAFPFWNPLADPSPAEVYDWLGTGSEITE